MLQQLYNYFYVKIAISFSKFLQNIHQNASFVTCFQNILYYEKYPIASVYLKHLLFILKNVNFRSILKKISSKYTPKHTKLHHFYKFSRFCTFRCIPIRMGIPPNPLVKRMTSSDKQISKSENKCSPPPPPDKSWQRP